MALQRDTFIAEIVRRLPHDPSIMFLSADFGAEALAEDQKELVELNKKAFGDLVISIDCSTAAGKVAFSMIKNTKTKEYPTGDITIAWLRLKKKYEPSTAPQLMRLTREFYHKFLRPDQDPDVFITEMEALQIQMQDLGHHMPDKNLIMQVLNNLTRDYEMDVNMLEYRMEQLKIENKELTIEDVRSTLNLRYIRLKTTQKVPHKSVEHAYYMGGKFKGKCHWCGKIGHKSSECKLRISGKPKNNENQETRNYGKNPNGNSGTANKVDRKNLYCTYCKNKGHDVNECRKKKREESGYNPSTVKEVACMAMERTTSTNPIPSVGTCIGCARWGPAFEYCTVCGEDTGMIYYPEENRNNDIDDASEATTEVLYGTQPEPPLSLTQEALDNSTDTEEHVEEQFADAPHDTSMLQTATDMLRLTQGSTSTEAQVNKTIVKENAEADTSNPTQGLQDQRMHKITGKLPDGKEYTVYQVRQDQYGAPTPIKGLSYLMEKDHNIIAKNNDPFNNIPIENLFRIVWSHTDVENYLIFGTEADYIEERCATLRTFGFDTIASIVQNIDNINFNIRLHHAYIGTGNSVSSTLFFPEELTAMTTWGVHLMQHYTMATNNTATDQQQHEVMYAMTGKPWNLNNKPKPTAQYKNKHSTMVSTKKVHICTSETNSPPQVHQGIEKIFSMVDYDKHSWLGDSGASGHFVNDDTGMFNVKNINEEIHVGDGRAVYATKIGDLRLQVHQRNGETSIITLQQCKYIKELPRNLFSITQALAKGWNLRNNGIQLILTKHGGKIIFDTVDPTPSGFIMKVRMTPIPLKETINNVQTRAQRKQMPTKPAPKESLSDIVLHGHESTFFCYKYKFSITSVAIGIQHE